MDEVKLFCAKDCPDTCSFYGKIVNKSLTIKPGGWDFLDRAFVCRKLIDFYKREIKYNPATSSINSKPCSIDKVLNEVAKLLKNSKNKNILYYRGSGNLGYSMYAWDLIFSKLNNVYFVDGSPCDETGIEAHIEDFGICTNPPIENLEKAEAILIFGKNIHTVSPHLFMYLKKLSSKKEIIYIDPIETKTSLIADKYIRLNPSSDGALAYALIDALGYHKLKNSQEAFNSTGIELSNFDILKKIIKRKKTAIIEGYGLQRYQNGKNSIKWLNRLAYLSGNVELLYYSRSSKEGLKKPSISPKNRVYISDVANYLDSEFFDIIIVVASNPVISLPDNHIWEKALKKSIGIVIDTNLTATSILAKYFIKVGGMFTQKDIQGSYFFNKTLKKERLVNQVSDYDAAAELAKKLGYNLYLNLEDVEDKKHLKRKENFDNIPIVLPKEDKEKVRLISLSNPLYLNSQTKITNNETIFISKELADKKNLKDKDRIIVRNKEKYEEFECKINNAIAGNISFVYKNKSKKTNYIYSSIPTDTKRAIAFNDTFIEIEKAAEPL